ncbi:MAG TPA: PEP-CTERM sorting domain-containing protein [Aquabacterium sp.]|uniref:PEP-CTERM sorting domain-containing protein n=1 Tax=Aquabacterium sp. TaxID=1872578 RepID=UPI002E330C48|nr:PEP-CTERM sorting domain-containing protein [Aquabacterium sp.]HEX5372103.1 PEP-CTERM sorting domain-containing protein [Aquabacterium sp.]
MIKKSVAIAGVALWSLSAVDAALAARLTVISAGQAGQVFEQGASIDGTPGSVSLSGEPLTQGASGQVVSWFSDAQADVGGSTQAVNHFIGLDAQTDPSLIDMTLSAATSWTYTATSAGEVSGYELTQDLFIDQLQVQIAADAGDLSGQLVRVNWSGLIGGTSTGELPLSTDGAVDLVVSRQGVVLGSHSVQVSDTNTQPGQFTFLAAVGDVLDLSWIAHRQTTQTVGLAMVAGQSVSLSQTTLVTGQLSVSAVPEPESVALLLAGLGVVAVALRKR